MTILDAIKLTARIWSLLSIGFVLLFIFGEGINLSELYAISIREIAGLLMFPIGLLTGFLISWKNEITGSIISIGSMIIFMIIISINWIFFALSAPALLFLLHGVVIKKQH